jgi:hypothetical protein
MTVLFRKIGWPVCLAILLAACRSNRPAVTDAVPVSTWHASCYPVGSITVSKCKWVIVEGQKNYQLNGSIYIRPDSICYFRGTMMVEIFRGVIDKDSFAVINRMDRICYKGSNRYLSRMVGYPVNPEMLYLLFTADRCEKIYNKLGFRLSKRNNKMMLHGKNANSIEIEMDADDKNIEGILVRGQTSASDFKIAYHPYQTYPLFALPSGLDMAVHIGNTSLNINTDFQEIRLNQPQTIHFDIPHNYKIVLLK